MKKILCMLLTSALMLGSVTSAFADESEIAANEKIVVADDGIMVADDVIIEETRTDEKTISEDEVIIDEAISDAVVADETIGEKTDKALAVADEDTVSADSENASSSSISETEDFVYSGNVSGYTVDLFAKAGVFPKGTSVNVKLLDDKNEQRINEMIQGSIEEETSIAKTATFDFSFTDKDGNVIEPQDGDVEVSVKVSDEFERVIQDLEQSEIRIYHISNESDIDNIVSFDVNTAEEIIEDGAVSGARQIKFNASSFSYYSIVVISKCTQDTTAPIFTSFKVSSSVYYPGDKNPFQIEIGAADSQSGVKSVSLTLRGYSYGQETSIDFSQNTNGVWIGTLEGYIRPDYYYVKSARFEDKSNNSIVYSNDSYTGTSLPSFCRSVYITVKSAYAGFQPMVTDFRISANQITLPSSVTVSMQMYNYSGQTLSHAMVNFVCCDEEGNIKYKSLVKMTPSGGNWYYGSMSLPRIDDAVGTYKIDFIRIYNQDGYHVEYGTARNYLPNVLQGNKLTTKKENNGLTSNFELESVKFQENSTSVTSTDDAKVAIAVTLAERNDSATAVKLTFINSNGNELTTYIAYKSGNTFVGYIDIPRYSRTGTYYLEKILIEDKNKNYFEYNKKDNYTIYNIMRVCYIDIRSDGKWMRDMWGYWYQRSDGSYPHNQWELINGKWYLFDYSGYMKTGWQQRNGKWYYLNSNGAMLKGWQKINGKWYLLNSDGEDGYMKTGWQQDKDKWYYLTPSGYMATGWVKLGNIWYYMKASGVMATGWAKIDGDWYYFTENGRMQTGWVQDEDKWYYMSSSGAMYTGWLQLGNNWYYLYGDGHMAQDTWVGNYYLDVNGVWTKRR